MNHDFNLKHLEYFVQTAKIGSINKAAQSLFISQPHLGKIIREMEDDFGAPLFYRSSQGVTLTPEGKRVLKAATEILNTLDNIHFGPPEGTVQMPHLSVSMTRFFHIMESFIEVVVRHEDQPAFVHRLYEGTPEDVCEDVLTGRSEVGVLHFIRSNHERMERKFASKGLTYHFLAYVEPHIIISKNHPLLQANQPVNLDTLADYGFIRYLGQYDDLFPELFNSPGRAGPAKVIYVSTRGSVMHLIAESTFYTVGIYDFNKQSDYQAVSIPIALADRDLAFEFGYITTKDMPLSSIAMEFIDVVKTRIY